MSDPTPQDPATPPGTTEVDLVRRRLLILGGRWVAPAVLASLILEETAFAQQSCQPNQCPPVRNRCGPLRNCRPGR